jgi:hypothetical protein
MLNLLALLIFFLSLLFTISLSRSDMIFSTNDDPRKKSFERVAQRLSVWITVIGFVVALGYHLTHAINLWGIIAVSSAIFGVVYLCLCKKQNVSPYDSENPIMNGDRDYKVIGTIISLHLIYMWLFTWIQLPIVFLTAEL